MNELLLITIQSIKNQKLTIIFIVDNFVKICEQTKIKFVQKIEMLNF